MRIFLTGDTHGIEGIFNRLQNGFPQLKDLKSGEENYLIILGDCGLFWSAARTATNIQLLEEWLETKPFKLMMIMGNHENYDILETFAVSTFKGGQKRQISKNIMVLETGSVFTFDEKTFGVFGGAVSIDRRYRTTGVSWWNQEIPNDKMSTFVDNLAKHNWKVDYLLTHTVRESLVSQYVKGNSIHCEVAGFLEFLIQDYNLQFKQNYHGHFHLNSSLHDNVTTCLFEKVLEVGQICASGNNKNCEKLENLTLLKK